MLTAEENELFTKVGPKTPVGKLMRWYWHPIAAAIELDGSQKSARWCAPQSPLIE